MKLENQTVSLALLIPCYNAEEYLPDFFRRIELLIGKFDEIIFYDDASTDKTLTILKESGYKFISGRTNKGPGYARNILASHTICEYIHFHDVDDEFNISFIPLIRDKLMDRKHDVILGNADWINANDYSVKIKWRYDKREISKDATDYFIRNPLGVINTVYKKSSFTAVNGFNEKTKCWEDADIHVRMASNGAKFVVINEVIAYSIRHQNGISNNQNWCNKCRLRFLENYLSDLPQRYKKIVLSEVMKTSIQFFNAKDFQELKRCIDICKKHGTSLPLTNNPVLSLLKALKFSPILIYRLQRLSIKFNV